MITKLAEKWRKKHTYFADICADELEAALPTWTRITDDPDLIVGEEYWCECLENYNQIGIYIRRDVYDDEIAHIFKSQVTDRFISVLSCRPLCDLDYPPEEQS